MRIFLVRHGDYVHEEIDASQPLSDQGKEEIRAISCYLNERGLSAAELWSSPKTRAIQSATIIQEQVCPSCAIRQREDLMPNADPCSAAAEIGSLDNDLVVVSHLPFIPSLVQYLTRRDAPAAKISTGMAVCLERPGKFSEWCLVEIASPDDYRK